MAGMSDNPLVGEYTKGISKGSKYFHDLRRRIIAEKADAKPVFSDLKNTLFAEATRLTAAHVAKNGLGRFGPIGQANSAPKSASCIDVLPPKTGWKVADRAMLLMLKQQLSGKTVDK